MYLDTSFFDLTVVKTSVGLVTGLVLGSFTTMLSYRMPRRLSIISPGSHCPQCKTPLAPRDLIPILSWLTGKGRCRHCQARIGKRYLLIELLTAALVMAAFMALGFTPELIVALLAIIALVTLITINIEKQRVE